MSNLSIRMRFEDLRSLASGSIAAGYTGVGVRVSHPVRQFFIQNLTDALLLFSFDGVNDHFPLPANGFYLSDITSNKTANDKRYGVIIFALWLEIQFRRFQTNID